MDNAYFDFDDTTDEYIFVNKSLEKAELIFIKGEEGIALKLARQMCGDSYFELTSSNMDEVLDGYNVSDVKCGNVIFLCSDIDISRELLQMIREKIGQRKPRLFFVGNGRIPNGVRVIAIVEIRPEKRCGIARKDGIGIEMLGPNCTRLTRLSLRYKKTEGYNNS